MNIFYVAGLAGGGVAGYFIGRDYSLNEEKTVYLLAYMLCLAAVHIPLRWELLKNR